MRVAGGWCSLLDSRWQNSNQTTEKGAGFLQTHEIGWFPEQVLRGLQ
jgi:hypothetical protein